MVGEAFASLSAFKSMFDLAKALKDINDATVRNSTAIELQEQILTAQAAQSTLIEQISALKAEIAKFETWDTEKQKYELKPLGWGAFAYMLKPDARGTTPPHWVCTNCYGKQQISIIQYMHTKGSAPGFACPACRTEIRHSGEALDNGRLKWLD
jgi:rubrerythrin